MSTPIPHISEEFGVEEAWYDNIATKCLVYLDSFSDFLEDPVAPEQVMRTMPLPPSALPPILPPPAEAMTNRRDPVYIAYKRSMKPALNWMDEDASREWLKEMTWWMQRARPAIIERQRAETVRIATEEERLKKRRRVEGSQDGSEAGSSGTGRSRGKAGKERESAEAMDVDEEGEETATQGKGGKKRKREPVVSPSGHYRYRPKGIPCGWCLHHGIPCETQPPSEADLKKVGPPKERKACRACSARKERCPDHEPGLSLVFLAQQALPLLQRLVVAAEAMGGREGRQPGGPPPSESDGEAALSGMMRLLQPGESLLGTPGRKTGKAGKVKSAETVESDEDGEDSESEEEEEGEGAGDK